VMPQLVAAAEERDDLTGENSRLTAELGFAAERLQFMQIENEALNKQVKALQQRTGLVVPAALEGAGDVGAAGFATAEAGSQGQGYAPGSPGPGTSTYSPDTGIPAPVQPSGPSPLEANQRPLVQLERLKMEEYLAQAIEESTDPFQRELIGTISGQLESVRDLYAGLRDATTIEERQGYLDQIAASRTHLRGLVHEQQAELMRREMEDAGVTDPARQEQLIESFSTLQKSPWWTEPMFVWGMAPDPPPELGE